MFKYDLFILEPYQMKLYVPLTLTLTYVAPLAIRHVLINFDSDGQRKRTAGTLTSLSSIRRLLVKNIIASNMAKYHITTEGV